MTLHPALKKALLAIVGVRLVVLGVAAFLPLSLPGVWRQTDTLGVALRYWLRWTVETGAKAPLLPAVLNSGDTSGIMPMEFPALNLLFAPAFAAGPYWGRVLAMLGILALVYGLIYLNCRIWKNPTLALIAVASFSSGWSGKFIPDLISVLLILLALGMSWEKPRPYASGALTALGLLMKPTSVVVLFLGFLQPKKIRANAVWVVAAVAVAGLYYTAGMSFLKAHLEGPSLFAVDYHPFFRSLVEFFSDVHDWTNMWAYRSFFSLGIYIVLPLSVFLMAKERSKKLAALWGVLIAQYLAAAGLAGTHGFIHDYYFLGLAPTGVMILGELLAAPLPKWVGAVILIGILVPTVELSLHDLKPLYRGSDDANLPRLCSQIREHHPEAPWGRGEVFRSSHESYPTLGLCLGEREDGAKSRYGFFWNSTPLPSDCKPKEITQLITFAECAGVARVKR